MIYLIDDVVDQMYISSPVYFVVFVIVVEKTASKLSFGAVCRRALFSETNLRRTPRNSTPKTTQYTVVGPMGIPSIHGKPCHLWMEDIHGWNATATRSYRIKV